MLLFLLITLVVSGNRTLKCNEGESCVVTKGMAPVWEVKKMRLEVGGSIAQGGQLCLF